MVYGCEWIKENTKIEVERLKEYQSTNIECM